MENQKLDEFIGKVFKELESLVPYYTSHEPDKKFADGNVAVCIITEDGLVFGKMFGANKPRLRYLQKIAYIKASQVWLTGIKTGEYEKMVFNGLVEENANGIENPDLIGWPGGQPLTLQDGSRFSVGFSGFRGAIDLEIMVKAFHQAA